MFPDAGDVNIKPIKRSQVTITGTIDGVYSARQQLVGNLPVSLIFDFPENNIESEKAAKIMKNLDVFINIRQKTRQSSLCVVIKGIEKFVDKIYDARQQLLDLHTPRVLAKIPSTYFSSHDNNMSVSALLSNPPQTPTTPITPQIDFASQPWNFAAMQNKLINLRHQLAQNVHPVAPPSPISAGQPPQFCLGLPINHYLHGNGQNQSPISSTGGNQQPNQNTSTFSQNTSGYQSFSGSMNSLEQSMISGNTSGGGGGGSGVGCGSSNSYSNPSTMISPDTTTQFFNSYARHSVGDNSNDSGRMTPNPLCEYERRRVYGMKSMEMAPVRGDARVPTPTWSGMSLSKTSPLPPHIANANMRRDNMAVYNLGVTTSLMDAAPKFLRQNIANCPDIHSLLVKLGMEHYISKIALFHFKRTI